MFKKSFGLVLLAFFLFAPVAVLAVGDKGSEVPSLNPLCWHPEDCAKQSGVFVEMDSGSCETKKIGGVIEPTAWGKCLPAGKVTTSIAIGGKRVFSHMGEYILVVYNYFVAIAGILAVAVIIIAGLQWLTSGGNSDSITRSQKRITGAIIGLLIAYASYFILNNINPDLVNLRMLRVWMVRQDQVIPAKCSSLDKQKLLALAADWGDQKKTVKKIGSEEFIYSYENTGAKYVFIVEDAKKQFYCGKRFFIENAKDSTCFSDYCKDGDACVPFGERETPSKPNQIYICKQSSISGTITYSGNKTKNTDWNLPHITNENDHELWGLCKEGTMKEVVGEPETTTNLTQKNQGYIFVTLKGLAEEVVNFCNNNGGGFVGFVLMMPMDESADVTDEDHWLGIDGDKAVDLGHGKFFNLSGMFFDIQPLSGKRMLAHRKKVKLTDLASIDDYVSKNELKYWDVRVDPKYFIDPTWSKIGKEVSIKMDINADNIYDIDTGWGSSKELVDIYSKVVQSQYQKLFKDNKGDFPLDLTSYPTL